MKYTEKKLSFWSRHHKLITEFLQLFAIIGVVFLVFFIPNHTDFTGTGTVNLFPKDAQSKNYRVNGSIRVVDDSMGRFNFNRNTSYTLYSVDWPNGGHSKFDKCNLLNVGSSLKDTCKDTTGNSYEIELNTPPTQ